MIATNGPYDTACFHAQQAVEKLLKAWLTRAEHPIPRTHDVEELADICATQGLDLGSIDLEELSTYAVEIRYDADFWPAIEDARDALATAELIWMTVSTTIDGAAPESKGDDQAPPQPDA